MPKSRNVVLITIDCLRGDYCGYLGGVKGTTPTIDQMAETGLAFTNAIAPGPSTSESMPAIFTGSYPVARPDTDNLIDDRISRIRPHMQARETLPEMFQQAGYTTAGFSPNPFTTRYFGFDTGFDKYEDFIRGSRGRFYQKFLDGKLPANRFFMPIRVLFNWIQQEEVFKPWEKYYEEILKWTNSAEEPYFLWVHLMDAHHPYLASPEQRSSSRWRNLYANWRLRSQNYEPPFPEWIEEELETAYQDSVRYADEFVATLRNDLKTDDPVYVVTSDHGESFGEHGAYEHHGGAFGQHGHQEYHSYLYEENIHVPLVVSNVDQDASISEPFSLRDLKQLFDVLRNDYTICTDTTNRFVTARTIDGSRIAIRGERWKYLEENRVTRLFDLANGEEQSVVNDELKACLQDLATLHRQHDVEREKVMEAVEAGISLKDV